MKNAKQRTTFLHNVKSTFAEQLILNEEDHITGKMKLQKIRGLVILYCRYHCYYDSRDPFIWLINFASDLQALLRGCIRLLFPLSILWLTLGWDWHTAFEKKGCQVWLIIWYLSRVLIFEIAMVPKPGKRVFFEDF